MGALLRILLTRLSPLLEELLRHFGTLLVRFFLWLKVARFGIFLIKAGVILGLVEVMADLIASGIDRLIVSMPPMLADGIGRVLPDNFSLCVSAILMAKFAVWAFTIKDRLIGMVGL